MERQKFGDGKKFTVSEVMDSWGVSRLPILVCIAVGFAIFFEGYDYMIVSYTMHQISAEWSLDSVVQGSLASWGLIGMVIGGIVGGSIGDKIGRRKNLTIGILWYSIFTGAIYFAPNYELFALFRVVAGFGTGMCIPTCQTYIVEFAPSKKRGTFIAVVMAYMVAGWASAAVVSMLVIPAFGWRFCYLLGFIPFIFGVFLHFFMHESPQWLAMRGRLEEACKELTWCQKIATKGKDEYVFDPELLHVPIKAQGANALKMFSKPYIRTTIGLWLCHLCATFTVYGVNAWLPSLLLEKGYSLEGAYTLALIQNVAAVCANVSVGALNDILGRRKNLFIGFTCVILACIACAFVESPFPLVIFSMIFLGFAVNYATTDVNSMVDETYPTEFRNGASGMTSAFGRFGGAIAPIVCGAVLAMNGTYAQTMLFFCLPAACGILVTLFIIKNENMHLSIDEIAARDLGIDVSPED
ncbi:MFS transporter [Raoultibacter phocaeensis]|uniref:MFS transporter n=1 Tax=Raoultibacter phocaeensis TaxID=2479841 RepID=UPI00111BBC61|nr:MFS transporter [Raoultibacter phocaeensis]